MVTTIQVQENTLELLKKTKKREGSSSYDETILALFRKSSKKSMAGALSKKKKYSRKELLVGIRDKFDRI